MNKEEIISEVLLKCQRFGKAYIVGGYLRNKYLGYDFVDVDLLTTCSHQRLKSLFPQLNWTEKGLERGITRMVYRGINFEFSSCLEDELEEKIKDRDYTINSFYFDGENLKWEDDALRDIENRKLHPTKCFLKQLDKSPQAYIRGFRFVSLYNLKWSAELLAVMKENASTFDNVPTGRKQNEAYEMLKGENIIRTLYYYAEVNLISRNDKLEELKDFKIHMYSKNFGARLVYLSYLIGKTTVIDWIKLHHISAKFIDEIQEYLPYLKTEELKVPPKKLPYVTLLKRYQYQDDKEKIKSFLRKNR